VQRTTNTHTHTKVEHKSFHHFDSNPHAHLKASAICEASASSKPLNDASMHHPIAELRSSDSTSFNATEVRAEVAVVVTAGGGTCKTRAGLAAANAVVTGRLLTVPSKGGKLNPSVVAGVVAAVAVGTADVVVEVVVATAASVQVADVNSGTAGMPANTETSKGAPAAPPVESKAGACRRCASV
jgi:hypothetical protein